ncbi:MAG: tachylectin-related carbohydrate-binding protein [Planctomycetota bacterium]
MARTALLVALVTLLAAVPASADGLGGLGGLGEGSLAGATISLNGTEIGTGWQIFREVVGGQDGYIYAVRASDGQLRRYRDGARDGSKSWSVSILDIDWHTKFAKVSCGADGRLYCVKPDGNLVCMVNQGNGWMLDSGKTTIAGSWTVFREIVGGHDGIIYGVSTAGNLHYYKDLARDGTKSLGPNWGAKIGGPGWDAFPHVFGGWRGIIYAVRADGKLRIYRDLARDGSTQWEVVDNIGSGFDAYDTFCGGEDGVFYARKPSGTLHIFRVDFPNIGSSGGSVNIPNATVSTMASATPTLDGATWTNNGAPKLAGHWAGLDSIFGSSDGILYARVANSGDLRLYRNKNTDGTAAWANGTKIGADFNRFTKLFGGWNGRIYGIEPDGTLRYFVDNGRDGTSNWGAQNVPIGAGWNTFHKVFGGQDGIIYAIGNDNYLYCYVHKPDAPAGKQWSCSTDAQRRLGWKTAFAHVFGGQNGLIYCVKADGKMRVYLDRSRDGSLDMVYREDIASGFIGYTSMWGGDDGIFYGQKSNGDVDIFKVTFGGSAFASVSVSQNAASVTLGYGGNSVTLNGDWVNGSCSSGVKIRSPFGDVDMIDCGLTVDTTKKLVLGHAKLKLPLAGALKNATGIDVTLPDAEIKLGYGRDLGALTINGTTWQTEPDNFYLYCRRNGQASIQFGAMNLTIGPGGSEYMLDLKRFNFFIGATVNLPPIDGNGFVGLFLGNPLNMTLEREFRTDFNTTTRTPKTLPVHMMIGGGCSIPTLPLAGQRNVYLNIDRDGDGKTIFSGDPVTDMAFAIEGNISLSLGTYGIGFSVPLATGAVYVDLGAADGFEVLVSGTSGVDNFFAGTPFEEFGVGGETREFDARLSKTSCMIETRYASPQLAGFRLLDVTATIAKPGGLRAVGKFPWPGSAAELSGTFTGPHDFVLTGTQDSPISHAALTLTSTSSSKSLRAQGWLKLGNTKFTLDRTINAPNVTIWTDWAGAKVSNIRFPPLAPDPLPDPPALVQGSVGGSVRCGVNPATGKLIGRANLTATVQVRNGITDSFTSKTVTLNDLSVNSDGEVSFTVEGHSFTIKVTD